MLLPRLLRRQLFGFNSTLGRAFERREATRYFGGHGVQIEDSVPRRALNLLFLLGRWLRGSERVSPHFIFRHVDGWNQHILRLLVQIVVQLHIVRSYHTCGALELLLAALPLCVRLGRIRHHHHLLTSHALELDLLHRLMFVS